MEDYRKIAIELGQTLISKAPETREDVERMLPELREGEDERIRKEITELVMQPTWKTEKEFHRRNELCAWLEKQGEQPSDTDNKFIRMRETKPKDISEFLDRLTTVEQEFLWEHIAKIRELNKEEQKPAWSEEDETTKNNISHIIRQYDKISKRENQPCWYVGDCLLWMQNIKDRVQLQPKQEWSEEDEKTMTEIFSVAAKASLRKNTLFGECYDYIKWQNWLKSLRPQNRWKPSDEMLKALYRAIPENTMAISEDEMLLDKLYQGLKYGRVLSNK